MWCQGSDEWCLGQSKVHFLWWVRSYFSLLDQAIPLPPSHKHTCVKYEEVKLLKKIDLGLLSNTLLFWGGLC